MKETSRRQSLLSTFAVMTGTLGSRILGFVRIALISMFFGAKGEADVLNAVFNIPNNFRKLLAEGALSSAFIPELSRQIIKDPSGKDARKLSRNILALQLLILLPISIFCILFPEAVLKVFMRFKDPEMTALAVRLFRWLFHYILLISINAVLMAVLNSHNQFLIPAVSPLLFSISVICSIVIWHDNLGIFSMVIGVLGGGVAQILWQFPRYRKLGYSLLPRIAFRNEAFRRVMKQWVPVLITSSIFTINQQVAILLATGLAEGSTTALSNAIVFWQLPFGIFSASITTVLFPKMSRLAGSGEWEKLSATLQDGIHMLGILLVPSCILLVLFGREIIVIALQRGEFTYLDSTLTAAVLSAYCPGMLFVGIYNLFQRSFYSQGNYKLPLYIAGISVAEDITLSLIFLHLGWGVVSLAWANSIAMTTGSFLLAAGALKGKITFKGKRFVLHFSKVLLAQIPLILFVLFIKRAVDPAVFELGSSWRQFGILALEGLSSLVVLAGVYYLMKLDVMRVLKKR